MPNHYTVAGMGVRDYDQLEKLGMEDPCELDLTPLDGLDLCEAAWLGLPMPEMKVTTESDWRRAVYGTKAGAYDTEVHELGGDSRAVLIEFQTAWEPPNAKTMALITKYLREKYCLTDIHWLGVGPHDHKIQKLPVD